MTEKEFIEWLHQQNPDRRVSVQHKFIDELNKYGEIRSREEFLDQAKKELHKP